MLVELKMSDGYSAWVNPSQVVSVIDRTDGKPGCVMRQTFHWEEERGLCLNDSAADVAAKLNAAEANHAE